MRQIKFRAWDKEYNYMIYFGLNDIYDGGLVLYRDYTGRINADEQCDIILSKDIEIMQYTGLKDTNGKEIYEGDVLIETHPYSGNALKATVIWHQPSASFTLDFGNSEVLEIESAYTLEVIGNIYESLDTKRSNR